MAEISSGVKVLSPEPVLILMAGFDLLSTTEKGKNFLSDWTAGSAQVRPMSRLASKTVLVGLVVSWFLAESPISRSPSEVKATYDGVIRLPRKDLSDVVEFAKLCQKQTFAWGQIDR